MTRNVTTLSLLNVLFCCTGRKGQFKHDSRCQVGSYMLNVAFCGGAWGVNQHANFVHMLNALLCSYVEHIVCVGGPVTKKNDLPCIFIC